MMRSKRAALQRSMADCTCFERARLAWRVASERMNTRSSWIAFMRIRSPRSAPPVFRLLGSTDRIAIVFPG